MPPLLLLWILFILLTVISISTVHGNEEDGPSSYYNDCQGRLALVTGATGSTGRTVTQLLLEKGFCVRALTRNKNSNNAKNLLEMNNNNNNNRRVELVEGDLGDSMAVKTAFEPRVEDGDDDGRTTGNSISISHVVFCAGGDDADYDAVNHRGVIHCAEQAKIYGIKSMVVISAAWVSKPYSIASLLFNSIYPSRPMALHMQGEERMKEILKDSPNTNTVILRAARLVPDDDYPKGASKGIWISQGDHLSFFGPGGNPGMSTTQLAQSVVAALQVQGQYTVEITSGTTDVNDINIYNTLLEDDKNMLFLDSETIFRIHSNALDYMRNFGIAIVMIFIISLLRIGWKRAIALILGLDMICVLIYTFWVSDLSVVDALRLSGADVLSSNNEL